MTPKTSIIVAVYNAEQYIAKCLESLLAQSRGDLEVLCVDDRGPDNSMDIVHAYADKDPRIRILRHDTNRGPGAARNTALAAARGEYCAVVDSDDWVTEKMLERTCPILDKSDLPHVWFKFVNYMQKTGEYTISKDNHDFYSIPEGPLTITPETITVFPDILVCKLFRTEVLRNNELFCPEGIVNEDLFFHYRFFTQFPKTYMLDEYFYVYRRRTDSIMDRVTNQHQLLLDAFTACGNLYDFYTESGIFETYRSPLATILGRCVVMRFGPEEVRRQTHVAIKELLDRIGFPNGYEDHPMFKFLDAARRYTPGKEEAHYRFLRTLTKLIPFTQSRRRIRGKIQSMLQLFELAAARSDSSFVRSPEVDRAFGADCTATGNSGTSA